MMKYTKDLIDKEQKELASVRKQLADLQFEIQEEEKENVKQIKAAKERAERRKQIRKEYEERRRLYHDIQTEKSMLLEQIRFSIQLKATMRADHLAAIDELDNS